MDHFRGVNISPEKLIFKKNPGGNLNGTLPVI